jgi:phosphoribosylformylglycinamidine synthase
MSESQERMMAIVEPPHLERFLEITRRWDVEATVIGEVTDGDRLVVTWADEVIVDVPPRSVAHDGPVYRRPLAPPAYQKTLQANGSRGFPRAASGEELRSTLLTLLASPNLCDKSWVTQQYDRYVLGNTTLAMPDDAGVVRVDEETGRGVALSTDGNGRFVKLDPYAGAQLALAEAYRNVATVGATPLAVTDCLNFGSPEDPGVMWQFREAVRGLAEGCKTLGIPVTGGNVSFYNQTGDVAIHPTPVVGVLGVMSDVSTRTGSGFEVDGSSIFLLGTTEDELDGSEWAHVVHDHLGGRPPAYHLDHEKRLAGLLVAAATAGVLDGAHDLSEGGLAQALAESVLRFGVGARVSLGAVHDDAFVALFSESTGRVLVSVVPGSEDEFRSTSRQFAIPSARIGVVDEGTGLVVEDQFTVELPALRDAYSSTLSAVFGR